MFLVSWQLGVTNGGLASGSGLETAYWRAVLAFGGSKQDRGEGYVPGPGSAIRSASPIARAAGRRIFIPGVLMYVN